MNNHQKTTRLLEDAIERAIIEEPAYARTCAEFERVLLDDAEAMQRGIATMATNGPQLFVNADRVATLSPAVVLSTLVEEAYHVLHRHHLRMRGLDLATFNVAADVRIAHDLREAGYELNPQMEGAQPTYDAYRDGSFDVEAIYDAIFVEREDENEDEDETGDETGEDQPETNDDEEDDQNVDDESADDTGDDTGASDDEGDDEGDEEGDASDEEGDEEGDESDSASQPSSGDESESEDEAGEEPSNEDGGDSSPASGSESEEEAPSAIPSAGGVLPFDGDETKSDVEIADEEQRVDELIIESHRVQRALKGTTTGGMQMLVDEVLRSRDDVASAIAHLVEYAASDETSWSRPNRRYVHSGMYLPGRTQQPALNAAIGFDTSGSMSERDYRDCMDLALGVLSQYEIERVDLVQVDTQINKVQTIERFETPEIEQRRTGFGGSNMIPFFQLIDDPNAFDVDADGYDFAILFTDGEVFWPEDEPDTTTLIVFVGTYIASEDAPIGTTLRLR